MLCSSKFAIGNFSYHLHDVHTTTLHTYKAKFPAAELDVPDWKCGVCLKDVKWMGPAIRSHLRNSHQLNLQSYMEVVRSGPGQGAKDSTLPWFEYKVIKCNICDSMMSISNIRDHLSVRHSCSLLDYQQIFPDVDLTAPMFQCGVCQEKINWNRRSIQQHLTSHDMSLQYYDDNYNRKVPEDGNKEDCVCSLCNQNVSNFSDHITVYHNLNQEDYLKIFPEEGDKFSEKKGGEGVLGTKIKIEPGIPSEKPRSKEKKNSDQEEKPQPWYESKLTTCRHCSKQFWHGVFIKHIHSEHHENLKLYKAAFPDADLTVGQYVCLICGASLAHYSSPISGHLSSRHGMTVKEYYQEYHLPSTRQAQPDTVKFQCKICRAETDCDYKSIKLHLHLHGLSWTDYQNYSSPEDQEPRNTRNTETSAKTEPALMISEESARLPPPPSPAVPRPPPLKRMPAPTPTPPTDSAQSKLEKYIQMDPYYNKCKWTCLICYKVFSSGFWRHVNESHFLKKEEYLNDFGRQGIMIVNYSCELCQKKIPWTGVTINNHLKTVHQISLLEYEKSYRQAGKTVKVVKQPSPSPSWSPSKSEKWFNGSEYCCQLCQRTMFSMAGLTSHLKEAHSRGKMEYLREFGSRGITVRHYNCKICGNRFPWTGVSISKHLRLAHTLSLSQYSARYESNNSSGQLVRRENSSPAPPEKTKSQRNRENFSPELSSKKWYNKCSWECQICWRVFTTNSSVFFKHVSQDHKMTVEVYKEQYGSAGVLFSDHTCRICLKKIPCNGLALCKHLKHGHNLSLTEYEDQHLSQEGSQDPEPEFYSPRDESWYNKCYWSCNICGNKNRSLGSSKKHIQQVHHITYEEYFSAYGSHGIHEVEFTCTICGVVMSCNGVTIANHLTNTHKLTLADYEERYIRENTSPSDTAKRTGGDSAENTVPVEVEIKQEVEEEEEEESNSLAPVSNKESFSQVCKETRPWYQQCLYVCQLCGSSYFSTSALNNHCKRIHDLDRDQYIAKFADLGKFLEFYSCKICNKVFKCEAKALGAHILSVHKMSLDQYSAVYEPDRISHVNPTLDNDYYQIEMNVDENDVSAEMETESDNEKHFQIVSVQSLNIETESDDESSKDIESPVDEPNQSEEMSSYSVEYMEKSPPACYSHLDDNNSTAFKKHFESSDIQSNEMEEGPSTHPSSSQDIKEEGIVGNKNIPEDEDYCLESSSEEDNQCLKKMSNIRDVFDSDSE